MSIEVTRTEIFSSNSGQKLNRTRRSQKTWRMAREDRIKVNPCFFLLCPHSLCANSIERESFWSIALTGSMSSHSWEELRLSWRRQKDLKPNQDKLLIVFSGMTLDRQRDDDIFLLRSLSWSSCLSLSLCQDLWHESSRRHILVFQTKSKSERQGIEVNLFFEEKKNERTEVMDLKRTLKEHRLLIYPDFFFLLFTCSWLLKELTSNLCMLLSCSIFVEIPAWKEDVFALLILSLFIPSSVIAMLPTSLYS